MRNSITAVALALAMLSFVTAQQKGKVLMIVSEGESADLEMALTKEVGVMKSLLQEAGFDVVVSTASKRPLAAGAAKLNPDLKLGDVKVADYKGFIMPCMFTGASPLPPEGTAIVKEAVAKGKPLAAQTGSVVLLARAGVLSGKKYAIEKSWVEENPVLKDSIYSGEGIVQDGRIITSGICPLTAKNQGLPDDGTSKLTEALIAELKK
jgi:putative intracellular protease/amidase